LEARAALVVHAVEDLADDMEAAHEVGTAVADVQAHALASLCHQRIVTRQRALGAVEHHVGRVLLDGLLHVEGLVPLLAVLPDGVEVTLHHIELAVHRRQTLGWLHQDETIHAIRHVHADRRGRAVVHIQALVERLEGELRGVPRRSEAAGGAAAGARHRVQVDVVGHLAVGWFLRWNSTVSPCRTRMKLPGTLPPNVQKV
jgi:hypothetical protein